MRSAGLVLAIEVSRLARNNSDWYRLLDLSGAMDCLIGDEDGEILFDPNQAVKEAIALVF